MELMAARGIDRLLGVLASCSESFHFQSPSVAVGGLHHGPYASTDSQAENFVLDVHCYTTRTVVHRLAVSTSVQKCQQIRAM